MTRKSTSHERITWKGVECVERRIPVEEPLILK
jgi:hypothetical protein